MAKGKDILQILPSFSNGFFPFLLKNERSSFLGAECLTVLLKALLTLSAPVFVCLDQERKTRFLS